jgi:O-antigen/teichoic acid export membrane protein
MGLVTRQAIKNNVLAYVGVGIGVFTQLWVYPEDLEIKGFIDLNLKYAQLLLPFIILGVNGVMLKFLPFSQNDRRLAASQFFTRGMLLVTFVSAILLIACACLDAFAGNWLVNEDYGIPKIFTYRYEIVLMTSVLAYSGIVTTHLINFHRVAIPVIFNSLLLKIGLPITVLLYIGGWLTRYGSLLAILMTLLLGLIGLLLYAGHLGVLKFRLGELKLKDTAPKAMYSYAAFSFLGVAGSALILQLDVVMVGGYIGNEAAGVYTFAVFAATVIGIPYKAINSITSPSIAVALRDNDIATIQRLYQDASKILFATGGLIFTGLVICLPYVYEFTENTGKYAVAYSATVLLAASQLFDQVTSINATIFGQSKYYRWYITLLLVTALGNVYLNYLFIGQLSMGYLGAATATAISLLFFNTCKALFLAVKLKVQPLSWSVAYTFFALSAIGIVVYLLPDFSHSPYINLIVKGSSVVLLFYLFIRYTNVIPVMKKVLQSGLKGLFA